MSVQNAAISSSGVLRGVTGAKSLLTQIKLRTAINGGFRNNLSHNTQDIETIKSYGILIWGSFVLGFDEDDEKSLEKTVQMAKASRLDFACFNFLTPLHGTMVYDKFEKEGRLALCFYTRKKLKWNWKDHQGDFR